MFLTDIPKNIITVTISIQSVQIYQDFGKNTSTCTKKWYFFINEFKKKTIFTPIFVYFLYYFNAFNAFNAYIIVCEKIL